MMWVKLHWRLPVVRICWLVLSAAFCDGSSRTCFHLHEKLSRILAYAMLELLISSMRAFHRDFVGSNFCSAFSPICRSVSFYIFVWRRSQAEPVLATDGCVQTNQVESQCPLQVGRYFGEYFPLLLLIQSFGAWPLTYHSLGTPQADKHYKDGSV